MDKNTGNKSFSITGYAFQSFKHYGGRSIIFMIALASTLVLALLNISTSLQNTAYEQAVNMGGDAHFKYDNVTPEQIELLKKQKQIEWISEIIAVPDLQANKILPAEQEQSNETNSIELIYMENLKQMAGFKITDGEAPQKENEVAIPPVLAEYLGIEATVGAEFDVNLISFVSTFGENGQTVVETPAKFTVSGIIQRNINFEVGVELGNRYIMFVSKEFALANVKFKNEISEDNSNEQYAALGVYVKLKKSYQAATTAYDIAEIIGVDEDNIQFNKFYLLASLNNTDDIIMFYVIIMFFSLVGMIIIYNAFNIVIAKRTRHFGLLTLIGASKKQIRKCVYIEALLNTAVALPIGLVLGTFLSWVVMPVVRAGYDRVSSVYSAEVWSYLLTALITVFMVFAGAVIPARRAGKISPVEAAKFTPGNQANIKKSKKTKVLKNITLPSLARANLFRKKGGAGGIITSLSIVGVLFIGLSFILFSAYYSLGNLVRQNIASDIKVGRGRIIKQGNVIYSDYDGNLDILPENIIEQIKNLDGVKNSHVIYYQFYRTSDSKINTDNTEYLNAGYIFGVDDEIMLEYLKQAEAHEGSKDDLTSFENPENVLMLQSKYSYNQDDIFNPGQNVRLDIYSEFGNESAGQINLNISAITNGGSVPPYLINTIGSFPALVMPLSSFKANNLGLKCYEIHLDIDYSKHDSIIENLERICESEGNINYESFRESKKQYETQMISILALVFAGLGIVFLVSVLNLVSTTFIGIEQRKKELGVLSALGLGQKELRRMLKWEGIWVSLFSSIISIAGGFGIGCLFYAWIDSKMYADNYIELYFPILPITIFCIIYVFAPYIITSTAVRRLLNKNTTVELMGQEI